MDNAKRQHDVGIFDELAIGEGSDMRWYADDLGEALGFRNDFDAWRQSNDEFWALVDRAKKALMAAELPTEEHFATVIKMMSGEERGMGMYEIEDEVLSPLACYTIAQMIDPTEYPPVALARIYFGIKSQQI